MKPDKIIALIPARGGSKGVPRKNLASLGGFPLIAYSIAAARLCPVINRVIVSTDSAEIAELARRYKAEAPFLRPPDLAQDNSPDIEYIEHTVDWLKKNENYQAQEIVQLRPTTPLRDPQLLERAIHDLLKKNEATSLRSAHPLPEPPQKMMGITNGFFAGLFPNDPRPEYYNLPRQVFAPAYHPNGYIDIVKVDQMAQSHSLYGPRILAFVTPVTTEIDGPEELEYLDWQLERKGHPLRDYLRKG